MPENVKKFPLSEKYRLLWMMGDITENEFKVIESALSQAYNDGKVDLGWDKAHLESQNEEIERNNEKLRECIRQFECNYKECRTWKDHYKARIKELEASLDACREEKKKLMMGHNFDLLQIEKLRRLKK